jgi:acetylornithine deacetylase
MSCWGREDEELLLELLETPTVTPMEADGGGRLAEAQAAYAQAAAPDGLEVVYHEPPPTASLAAPGVPLNVAERARELGPIFLESQPSMALALGQAVPRERTVAFNVHFDTVAPHLPVRRERQGFGGRGAIDAKGPAVGLLAGIRAAAREDDRIGREVGVVVQVVGGEEGGAMGCYGTRLLVEEGFVGRLNVVAEPTRFGYFDRSTTSMTACIAVNGEGATDDAPEQGHNATVLLGAVAVALARDLGPRVEMLGAKLCIAGLHTGSAHNRVYGSGTLLVNLAYPSEEVGSRLQLLLEEEVEEALAKVGHELAGSRLGARTAADARQICSVRWLKRALPVLANRDEEMEEVLAGAAISRHSEVEGPQPFTCDAMWFQGNGHTVIFGPGDLAANGAHTDSEFVVEADLELYADGVRRLLRSFADWQAA